MMESLRFSERLEYEGDYIILGVELFWGKELTGSITLFSTFYTGLPGHLTVHIRGGEPELVAADPEMDEPTEQIARNPYSQDILKTITAKINRVNGIPARQFGVSERRPAYASTT